MSLEERLAATFSLGDVRQPLRRAATGWGGHNAVFHLVTSSGSWAVKRHGRPGIEPPEAGFAIEQAAYAGGVPMARPVPTAAEGRCWAELDGTWYRCHEWIDGTAKANEDTSASEAAQMGRIVAHLHGLALVVADPVPPTQPPPDLAALLHAGQARGARWAPVLAERCDAIAAIAAQPSPVELGRGELVGSHRDLNAHNVLFSARGLRLVDWDGAGPAWPRWERADFAVRWATRHDGSHDEEALVAFLRSYREGGGQLDAADPLVLHATSRALLPWVVENLLMAVDRPCPEQDELAHIMVEVLLSAGERVAAAQGALARALAAVL